MADYSAHGNIAVITWLYNQWALCCKVKHAPHKEVERGAGQSTGLVSFAVSNHKAMATTEWQPEIETALHYTPCCITNEWGRVISV